MVSWKFASLYYGANKCIINIQPNQKRVKLHLSSQMKLSVFVRVCILSDIRHPQHVSTEIEVSIRAWDWLLPLSAQTGNLLQVKIRPERKNSLTIDIFRKMNLVRYAVVSWLEPKSLDSLPTTSDLSGSTAKEFSPHFDKAMHRVRTPV